MKNLFISSALLFLFNTSFAQQTFNASGNSIITVDVKNNSFSLQLTKESKISIEVTIQTNYPKDVIDQLVKVDRYKITAKVSDGNYILSAPNLTKKVTIGGKALVEDIKIIAKAPASYSSKGTSIVKGEKVKSITEPVLVTLIFIYTDKPASTSTPNKKMGAAPAKGNTPKAIQGMYGDILIGGMSLEDFND
jgi:hypothetical protein